MLEAGDLVDVLAHGLRRSGRVAPPQCRDESFVSQDRSGGPALLLQPQLARLHEQVVQRCHDVDDHAIARGAREDMVKSRDLDDGRSARLELLALRVEDALEVGEVFFGHARGRDARNGGLEHAAHVQELVLQLGMVDEHGSERRDEPVDVELLGKRALTVPCDEEADGLQRTERVANRPAADTEPFGEGAFGGESLARRERAVEDQHANAVGNLFGDPGLSDRPHETSVAGAGPGGGQPLDTLDTPETGCQSLASNWFDHWFSLTRSQNAGMDDSLTFTATGSPQVVSRAIEEYARVQGNVTALVVPWESDGKTLNMAVTAVKSDGWAIEHTNLGTIRLIDAGKERTEMTMVTIVAEVADHPEQQTLASVFDRFVRQVQSRFQGAST